MVCAVPLDLDDTLIEDRGPMAGAVLRLRAQAGYEIFSTCTRLIGSWGTRLCHDWR